MPALTAISDAEAAALRHFKKQDPILYAAVLPLKGTVRNRVKYLRTRSTLFEALARSVIGQQLSTKAAESIRQRVTALCAGPIVPATLGKLSDAELRSAGLSGAKVKTLRALSTAVADGSLNLLSLKRATPEEAVTSLTGIWGIGPWTAEMFLMFSLGSPDIFSPGDLILARSVESLYGLPKNAPRAEIERITARWSPHRTYAALYLWERNDQGKEAARSAITSTTSD